MVAKTSPSTSTASGASLLASFLLLHSVLPRIRSLSMENTENAVRCLDFLAARRASSVEKRMLPVLSSLTPEMINGAQAD